MIKIVKGTYGRLNKNGTVTRMTAQDGPFSLAAEQEARLVSLGVAAYIDNMPDHPIGFDEQPPEPAEDRWTATADDLENLTVAELKKLAEDAGIDTKKIKKKAEIIAALTSSDAEQPDSEDEPEEVDEDFPDFDAAEAVQ